MAALDDYGPFDAGTGANRTEEFWRDFFRHLTGSGVVDGVGSEFAVSERGAGANMSVDVASGECFIRGHWGESTSTKNLAVAAADATNPRIDRVVLRADFSANTVSIEVLEGTPAGSPSAPALTQSSSRWEVSLAQISVPALDTTISTAQLTDERLILSYTTGFIGAVVSHSTTQSATTSTTTTLNCDTEARDNGGFHSTTSNNNRITVPTGLDGTYEAVATIEVESNTTGYRQLVLRKNNSAVRGWQVAPVNGTVTTLVGVETLVDLVAGDYIDLAGWQNSGGSLTMRVRHFALRKVG